MSGSHLWVSPFILFLVRSHRHVQSWVCGLAEFLNLGLGHRDLHITMCCPEHPFLIYLLASLFVL